MKFINVDERQREGEKEDGISGDYESECERM